MAQQTEITLRAFASQVNLRMGYQFSRLQINNFLASVQANPHTFGASQVDVADVQAICAAIAQLRAPDGSDYLNSVPYITKFKVQKSAFKGVNIWALPDMLGMLLGLLGPAPPGGTKRNFLLPITAMFAKWLERLCTARLPTVVQCTWSIADGKFCLGASMSGYNADKRATGSWLAVLNRARFSVIGTERFKLSGWSQAWSPSIRRRGKADGTPFGRCGETYPFCLILRDAADKDSVHGLALNALEGVYGIAVYDDRLSGPMWQNTWHPCANCKELIKIMGGTLANFDKFNGRQGAPA